MSNIFPRGIAQGKAFYDRVDERKKLKRHILNNIHTVLVAPRRYGKTSLMTQVLHENKIEHVWIDFMTITCKEDLQTKLLQKIGELIVKIAPVTEKLKKLLTKYFHALKPEITFKIPGIGISVKLNPENNQREGITEALTSLDNLAQELNIRLVIVFDEFQEITRIDQNLTLQGSIRHAAERAQQITYLFSGSKHRPLRRLFNGKENPLYALCEIMELEKISAEDYLSFINKSAKEKWGVPLDTEVTDAILTYSDQYPRYVNALCSSLWALYPAKPTIELIDSLWHDYVVSKKTDITEDLSCLTLNQRRLLQWLCFEQTPELYSNKTLIALKMSQSSVQKAIGTLLEKDLVAEKNGIYQALDPVLISYFKIF